MTANVKLRRNPNRDPGHEHPHRHEPASPLEQLLGALARIETALAPTDRGVEIKGARVVAINTNQPRISVSGGRLIGFSFRETTDTARAVVVLRAGQDNTGDEIAGITLAAGESDREWFGEAGLNIGPEGLYIDVLSGSVAGAIYFGAVD